MTSHKKKLWNVVSVVVTIIGLIDYAAKLFSSMEFLREYIFMIIGGIGFLYLVISHTVDYLRKRKFEKNVMDRFNRFKYQYDGLFDADNQSLHNTQLARYFTDKEISCLANKGYVKLQIKHVL